MIFRYVDYEEDNSTIYTNSTHTRIFFAEYLNVHTERRRTAHNAYKMPHQINK